MESKPGLEDLLDILGTWDYKNTSRIDWDSAKFSRSLYVNIVSGAVHICRREMFVFTSSFLV